MDDERFTSTFEELDAQPELVPENRMRMREFVLGILILLLVAGWAGANWLQQKQAADNYHAAEQALAIHDYDKAHGFFAAAAETGFRDSRLRANDTAKTINERNTAYADAQQYKAKQQWLEALQAARQVESIQPGYGDTAALLSEAHNQVAAGALGGSVALRPDADPPGLYYFSPTSGWRWLKNSDTWSTIQGSGPDGTIVYDVPTPGWVAPDSQTFITGNGITSAQPPSMEGRAVYAAVPLNGEYSFYPLAFVPSADNTYVAGAKGVWKLKDKYFRGDSLQVRSGYMAFNVTYEAMGSAVTSTVEIPSEIAGILDFSTDGTHLLVAKSQPDTLNKNDGRPSTDLYLTGATGQIEKLLYSYDGGFISAQFSRDGRYALLTLFSPVGGAGLSETQSVVLLDLVGDTAPLLLTAARSDEQNQNSGRLVAVVGATFISTGQLAGHVVVANWRSHNTEIRIIDPANPDSVLSAPVISLDNLVPFILVASQRADANLVLMGSGDGLSDCIKCPGLSFTNTVTFATVAPDKAPVLAHFELPHDSFVLRYWQRQGRIVFLLHNYLGTVGGDGPEATDTLYTAPMEDAPPRLSRLAQIYSATEPLVFGQQTGTSNLGPKLFAYLQAGTVHARTYEDQSLDVALDGESAVTALYNTILLNEVSWIR